MRRVGYGIIRVFLSGSFPCRWRTPYSRQSEGWGQILTPRLGDIVDSDIGLSYRPAGLCSLAGRYDQEGLTLPTVETRDSKSSQERDPSLVGSLGSSCRYKRFLSCPGCCSQPSTIFSSPYAISIHVSPSREAVVQGRLSPTVICVSGYDNPIPESTISPSQGLRIWLLMHVRVPKPAD